MKITEVEIRLCRSSHRALGADEMRQSTISDLEFLVLSFKTDDGLRADTFGFAGKSAKAAGHAAAASLKPFFIGRDPLDREKHWHDWRMADRWWHHVPMYSFGPFDIGCWLLGALAANQPLYKYIGAYRDRVPIYASSMGLPTPADYARQAVEVRDMGWAAYKLHPPGEEKFDMEAYHACREAVGPDFKLIADPVAAYNHQQALRIGRALEKLDYYWFEEPLFDVDIRGLRELARELDIPICSTEVVAASPYSTAEYIASGAVDIVRTDVSWRGGITSVLKTAHLAEAFGLQCEIHTSIFHPLELVNLHCCAAIKNSEFFEVLMPTEYFDFGLKEPIQIENGHAILPDKPGLGSELDWDYIDACTFEVL